jgi:hypothetical protein
VIRGVILHLNGEQPLMADLYAAPEAGDVGLRCTNVRMMNGKRPVFVDDSASIFFFPYLHIRFVEIPPGALGATVGTQELDAGSAEDVPVRAASRPPVPETEADLEIDEDLMRRIREV